MMTNENMIDDIDLQALKAVGQKKKREVVPTRQFLSMKENVLLANLMLAEYTKSGMTDREFAEYAQTKIEFRPGITLKDSAIKLRRDELDIPSNTAVRPPSDPAAYTAMLLSHEQTIKDLQERLAVVEGWINMTFPNRAGKKQVG